MRQLKDYVSDIDKLLQDTIHNNEQIQFCDSKVKERLKYKIIVAKRDGINASNPVVQ